MILAGKVAVVTGSGRGIGRATAEMLSELGARVVISDVDAEVVEQTASEINGEIAVFHGNLLQDGAPEKLIARAVDAFGRIDIIVNNAGYTIDAPAHKMSDEVFREMLELHTVVPFKIIRSAAPYLREPAKVERASGVEVFRKIVNVTSLAALGSPGQANYASAKAGLIGLTRTLAKEWGQFKVNVNAVGFGLIDTRLTAAKTTDTTIQVGARGVRVGIPEQQRTMLSASIPLGRGGTPREAAGGIAFLCSPWSDYVTGQVLAVSGGIGLGMNP